MTVAYTSVTIVGLDDRKSYERKFHEFHKTFKQNFYTSTHFNLMANQQ